MIGTFHYTFFKNMKKCKALFVTSYKINHCFHTTTSIIGMASVIDAELGQLIIDARYGRLPDSVLACLKVIEVKNKISFCTQDILVSDILSNNTKMFFSCIIVPTNKFRFSFQIQKYILSLF